MIGRALPLIAAVAALALTAGCGGGEGSTTRAGAGESASAPAAPVEPRDRPAKLPAGWKTLVDKKAGFSVGVPPGWKDEPVAGAQGTVLSSPDGLIVVTITADRSRGALELPLEEFAERTARALGSEIVGSGRFEDLEVSDPAPFKHTYDAAAARARGTARGNDFRERVLVVAVRRPELATYVVVARENAQKKSRFADRDTVDELIRSIRGRPPA